MGAILNFSTRKCRTLGEMNAGSVGPRRMFLMPKMLKDQMQERLDATALEMYGVENFTSMIADETICTEDPEELLNYLSEVGHPVLGMDPFDM